MTGPQDAMLDESRVRVEGRPSPMSEPTIPPLRSRNYYRARMSVTDLLQQVLTAVQDIRREQASIRDLLELRQGDLTSPAVTEPRVSHLPSHACRPIDRSRLMPRSSRPRSNGAQ